MTLFVSLERGVPIRALPRATGTIWGGGGDVTGAHLSNSLINGTTSDVVHIGEGSSAREGVDSHVHSCRFVTAQAKQDLHLLGVGELVRNIPGKNKTLNCHLIDLLGSHTLWAERAFKLPPRFSAKQDEWRIPRRGWLVHTLTLSYLCVYPSSG